MIHNCNTMKLEKENIWEMDFGCAFKLKLWRYFLSL